MALAFLTLSRPSTVAAPSSGSMMPQSMLMVVVLPASSGPTRAKDSPRATLRLSSRTARRPPKRLPSLRVSMAASGLGMGGGLPRRGDVLGFQRYDRLAGHARLKLVAGVLGTDLGAVDQGHALLLYLHGLG